MYVVQKYPVGIAFLKTKYTADFPYFYKKKIIIKKIVLKKLFNLL